MEAKEQSLTTQTVHGMSLLIIRELFIKGISLIGQLVLFRILTPTQFGVFAIVTFIVSFFELFSDVGFSSAIIQKKEKPSDFELSFIFISKQAIAIILFFLIIYFAPFIHTFYPTLPPESFFMMQVFAVGLLVKPYESIVISLLERDLKYSVVATIDILGIITYQITAIILALLGYGVWSLLVAILIKELIEFLICFFYTHWIPQIPRGILISEIKKMFHFGIFIQGQGLLNFFHSSLNPLIIGRLSQPYYVGLLDWSSSLVLASQSVTDNFVRVAFPAFSKLQHENKIYLGEFIKDTIRFINIYACFVTLVFLSLGKDIALLFTEKWIGGLPAIYFFAIANFINILLTPLAPAILGLGKSKQLFTVSSFLLLIEALLTYLLFFDFGFLSFPVAGVFIAFIAFISYIIILDYSHIISIYFKDLVPKLIGSSIIFMIIFTSNYFFPFSVLFFIGKLIILSLLFITMIKVISPKDFNSIYLFLKVNFRKFIRG